MSAPYYDEHDGCTFAWRGQIAHYCKGSGRHRGHHVCACGAIHAAEEGGK